LNPFRTTEVALFRARQVAKGTLASLTTFVLLLLARKLRCNLPS
jgi:hypothetical protein